MNTLLTLIYCRFRCSYNDHRSRVRRRCRCVRADRRYHCRLLTFPQV